MATPEAQPASVATTLAAMPRLLIRQIVLSVPLLLDVVVRAVSAQVPRAGWPYALGLLLIAVATGVAWQVQRRAGTQRGLALIGMLDLAGIGALSLATGGGGLYLLAILPAMWMAVDCRMRGVLASFAGTSLLVSLPQLVFFDFSASAWSRAVLLPTLAGICSLTMLGTRQVWVRQNQELEAQGRRLEQALAEVTANRALNDALVNTIDVGLVALDRAGNYKSVNPRMLEFLTIAYPDGHKGKIGQVGAVFAADRVTPLSSVDLPSMRAMRGEELTDYVIWVGEERARQRALSVSAGPIRSVDGSFEGVVLVYKDITDLMSALKVKDEFVASVSHELRTPLTSIIGFLELVLAGEAEISAAARQQLLVVKRNSDRLLSLVSDLLFTAQVDQGQIVLDLRRTDLVMLVEQSLAELGHRALSDGIAVQVDLPHSLMLEVDPARVRQVIDNLVSNALKYTPPGGTVSVTLRQTDEGASLEVRDSGIGIAEEDLANVFTRFFRTQDAQRQAIQGIGLGLAITRSIVQAHGGRIDVESEVGRGSTFAVTLPDPKLGKGPLGAELRVHHPSGRITGA